MSTADQTPAAQHAARPSITPIDIVRAVVLVAALASLVLWGFSEWTLPWSVILGVGTPIVALLLWALFLSPRPVLRVHPFIRAIVELLIYAAVTMCWWAMGQAWIGIAFAVVAVSAGVIAGRRAFA